MNHRHLPLALALASALSCKIEEPEAEDQAAAVVPKIPDLPQIQPAPEATEAGEQAEPAPRLADADISAAIEREMQHDPFLADREIEVQTQNGVVELTGSVDNLLAKQRAAKLAEQVRGVRTISNRVEVEPGEAVDDQTLAKHVREALLADPVVESYELQIRAENGVVTLTGLVDSWAERQIAERVASSIRGVQQIENNIQIEPPEARLDSEILAEVRGRLRWDVLVDHQTIEVDVENAKVSLSGTVGSAAERWRAYADAWTRGVTEVDIEGLEVDGSARDPDLRADPLETASATEIRDAILSAAAYDPRVSSFDIDPVVIGTTVRLRGTVNNLQAKQAAEQLARNTVGVAHVVNELEVVPKVPMTDADIKARIQGRLLTNALVDADAINIQVDDGVVTLTGTVDSHAEKAAAGDLAAGVRGVLVVSNMLEATDARAGLFTDPYDPYAYPWRTHAPLTAELSDGTLEERVEFELFWSPFVEEHQVEVDVLNGRVTLSGTVDSWRERVAAEEEAFEAGALSVVNLLAVDQG